MIETIFSFLTGVRCFAFFNFGKEDQPMFAILKTPEPTAADAE